jgi:glycosyltransferase involved in cell wall biosynthesis
MLNLSLHELPIPNIDKVGWPWRVDVHPATEPLLVTSLWPRITIITPSYNQAQFLEETIRSVLLQGYPNLEYIIIDGGSIDGSVDIIKKYEPWFSYWVSEPDRGQSHAINKGWERSTGEILSYINSDDLLVPGVLFRVADLYQRYPQAGFFHGTTQVFEGNRQEKFIFGSRFSIESILTTGINPVAQPSTFINNYVLNKVGVLDENLHMAMDRDLWIRIGLKFQTIFIDEVWSLHRYGEYTKTDKFQELAKTEHLYILRKLFKSKVSTINKRKIKSKAYSICYLNLAFVYYRNKKYTNSYWYFILALLSNPIFLIKNIRNFDRT